MTYILPLLRDLGVNIAEVENTDIDNIQIIVPPVKNGNKCILFGEWKDIKCSTSQYRRKIWRKREKF
ncbi:MAG: hypothetical protein HY738_11745 [Bacteroidia bacterium]|nr:hypothetical protein [Bacteroidia bacterium]